MQFLLSVIDDITRAPDETGAVTRAEQDAIDVFNSRLVADGYWVFATGLDSPGKAVVVDSRGRKPLFTDGPFAESKEFLAGFWIIDAPNAEVARELAVEGSMNCNRKVEVRVLLAG